MSGLPHNSHVTNADDLFNRVLGGGEIMRNSVALEGTKKRRTSVKCVTSRPPPPGVGKAEGGLHMYDIQYMLGVFCLFCHPLFTVRETCSHA